MNMIKKSFEARIGSFRQGMLYAVAGRPAMGKSLLMKTIVAQTEKTLPETAIMDIDCFAHKNISALMKYVRKTGKELPAQAFLLLHNFGYMIRRQYKSEFYRRQSVDRALYRLKQLAIAQQHIVFVEFGMPFGEDLCEGPSLEQLWYPDTLFKNCECTIILFSDSYYNEDIDNQQLECHCYSRFAHDPIVVMLGWALQMVKIPHIISLDVPLSN